MRLPDAFQPLRERQFRLLFGSRSVSSFGGTMAEVALAFAVLDIGRPRDLGFVILAREIPVVVLLLLGGVWADRLRRDLVLVVSDGTRGVAQAAIAALLLTGNGTVLRVALLQVLYGGANAFGRPAYTGLIQQTASVARLQQANALMGLSFSTVGIAGPAVGAVVVASANPGWALAADAATFAASVALLLRIALPPTLRVAGGSVLADFRYGWAEFVARPWVVAMVVWFGLFQLATFPALLVLGPYVAKHDLGGAGAWGAILAVEAAGSLIGGLLALRVRFRRPLAAMLVLGLTTPALLLMLGLAPPVWAISCVSFANGASLSLGGAVWFSTLQEKIPEHAISRISSFDWFGSLALNPIGYAAVGPLSEVVGVPAALYGAAALNMGSTLAVLALRSVRAVRAGPEHAGAVPASDPA